MDEFWKWYQGNELAHEWSNAGVSVDKMQAIFYAGQLSAMEHGEKLANICLKFHKEYCDLRLKEIQRDV